MSSSWNKRIQTRREFLRNSAMAGSARALLPMLAATPPHQPAGRGPPLLAAGRYRPQDFRYPLGGPVSSPAMRMLSVMPTIAVSTIDSADTYSGGESEPHRQCAQGQTRQGLPHPEETSRRRDRFESLDDGVAGGQPQRPQTDHVDVGFNHAINDVNRIKNPEWHEFTDAAKKQGKIRFAGMSGHAGRLIDASTGESIPDASM